MEKQVARCSENTENLIRIFLQEERPVIQQSLL